MLFPTKPKPRLKGSAPSLQTTLATRPKLLMHIVKCRPTSETVLRALHLSAQDPVERPLPIVLLGRRASLPLGGFSLLHAPVLALAVTCPPECLPSSVKPMDDFSQLLMPNLTDGERYETRTRWTCTLDKGRQSPNKLWYLDTGTITC
jgi:hypothetical protein